MRPPSRTIASVCLLAAVLTLTSDPVSAQFTSDELQCRKTVAAGATKATQSGLKSVRSCFQDLYAGRTGSGSLCGNIGVGALGDFGSKVHVACADIPPADVLYAECPAPCDATVPSMIDQGSISACMKCLDQRLLETLVDGSFGSPTGPVEKPIAACHKSLLRESSRFVAKVMKAVLKCQLRKEKNGETTTTDCTDVEYPTLTAGLATEFTTRLVGGECADLTYPIPALDGCGSPASVGDLAACLASNNEATARTLITHFLSLPAPPPPTTTTSTTVTTTSTTSTTLALGDPQCPGWAEVRLFSRDTDDTCVNNGDCTAPRTCNTTLGHCTSVTDTDIGWMGLAFDNDGNDGDKLRVRLQCDGPPTPGCGECAIGGMDSGADNCRCANDPTIVCDNPMAAHAAECGGAACNCYLGTPTPVSAGGAPFCLLPRIVSQPTGTLDVDTGAIDLATNVRLTVYLGESTTQPCPVCAGDVTPGDGVPDGTCHSAELGDHGSCDATVINASFDVISGGSGYSLDCLPHPGKNVSGAGLKLDVSRTTGPSSLSAGVSCQGFAPELNCHCMVCSSDQTVACNTHGDCSAQPGRCSLASGSSPVHCDVDGDCDNRDAGFCLSFGRCSRALSIECGVNADCDSVDLGTCAASTCSARGNGSDPLPNFCEAFDCSDLGDGVGECATGPDNKFCDGALEANGDGILACYDDEACAPSSVGIDAGSCTITERNACFEPAFSASGAASPTHPVLAATYCMPPTSNAGVNAAVGLPGPVRSIQQTSLVTYCAGTPASVYTPGVGGCP